ncbi:MAG: tRNA pseudouridine(55) synthase TruB [Woeseia sp.]|nr:tRNA pseudouridine(55) synthase TruB [Woeseia sp.]MBT8097536.1 tRNA pseudouridine(55) synthase TruB [Woeseia sp.]NNE60787.1 tRNA pseudouridine(55) synthase TruB [Woeseia sp.]
MPAPARKRRETLAVNGLLLLNKPGGMTSNRALQTVKRLFKAKKAGHTGSLDPAATGMLPLCFGEATKVCAYLLDADKTYRVVAKLGEATDTGDADGTVTATGDIPALDSASWQAIFSEFLGEISQVPPMYSALKKDGKRLYELARQGIEVERPARKVHIHALELIEYRGSRLAFRVACSKGTYVRTLVEDLAKRAGTLAHTVSLHREAVAGFESAPMLDLAALETMEEAALRDSLLPIDRALQHLDACGLAAGQDAFFMQGQPVAAPDSAAAAGQLLRAYSSNGQFLGIAEATGDGRLAPKRVFHLTP